MWPSDQQQAWPACAKHERWSRHPRRNVYDKVVKSIFVSGRGAVSSLSWLPMVSSFSFAMTALPVDRSEDARHADGHSHDGGHLDCELDGTLSNDNLTRYRRPCKPPGLAGCPRGVAGASFHEVEIGSVRTGANNDAHSCRRKNVTLPHSRKASDLRRGQSAS